MYIHSRKQLNDEARKPIPKSAESPEVLVAGALAVDYCCDFAPLTASASTVLPDLHTSNPCTIYQRLGGVGHNIAKAAHYLGAHTRLCSVIADDLPGRMAKQQMSEDGLDASGITTRRYVPGVSSTPQYVAINDANKDLFVAAADMQILESEQMPDFATLGSTTAKWFVMDGNWANSSAVFKSLAIAKSHGVKTALEPVSTAKATRLLSWNQSGRAGNADEDFKIPIFPNHAIDLLTPNQFELTAMYAQARAVGVMEEHAWWRVIDSLGIPGSGIGSRLARITSNNLVEQGIPQQSIQMLPFAGAIATKLGPQGVLLTEILHPNDERLSSPEHERYILSRASNLSNENAAIGGVFMRLFPPPELIEKDRVVSVNGVGDTFLGAILAAQSRTGRRVDKLVPFAQKAAALTLLSTEAVSPQLKLLCNELV